MCGMNGEIRFDGRAAEPSTTVAKTRALVLEMLLPLHGIEA